MAPGLLLLELLLASGAARLSTAVAAAAAVPAPEIVATAAATGARAFVPGLALRKGVVGWEGGVKVWRRGGVALGFIKSVLWCAPMRGQAAGGS